MVSTFRIKHTSDVDAAQRTASGSVRAHRMTVDWHLVFDSALYLVRRDNVNRGVRAKPGPEFPTKSDSAISI